MNKKIKFTITAITFSLAISFLVLIIVNIDIVLLSLKSDGENTTITSRLRYAIASFDIGQKSQNIPIKTRTSKKDQMVQVLVPRGSFLMGSNENPISRHYPIHRVYLKSYWIDRIEVTNNMYQKCVDSGKCEEPIPGFNPYYGKWAYRNHPVVYVNWFMANAYCKWAGRRLPTEAEWEKAARGTDARKYPWGDEPPTPALANYLDTLFGESMSAYRYPLSASPYGAINMVGNVREWVHDWYAADYYKHSPTKNPKGPKTGTEKSLRGSAYDADKNEITTYHRLRHEPDSAGLSRGFRCVQSLK